MPRANEEVARLLGEYADLLAIAGEDRFRIRAYENAARSVAGSAKDVSQFSVRELTKLSGVGKAIAEKVREYLDTGAIAKLDELRARVGGGVRDLLDVGGLGPKRAAFLHRELGISTVEELRAAAETGALRGLSGFGRTLEEKILRGSLQDRDDPCDRFAATGDHHLFFSGQKSRQLFLELPHAYELEAGRLGHNVPSFVVTTMYHNATTCAGRQGC